MRGTEPGARCSRASVEGVELVGLEERGTRDTEGPEVELEQPQDEPRVFIVGRGTAMSGVGRRWLRSLAWN